MRVRTRLTYANVMATVAAFLALGGGAYAISLGRNSVGSPQLKPGAVKLQDTAAALRLKCPRGTRYHEGACIERGKRPAATFFAALSACSDAGRRLPGAAELLGFGREPGIRTGDTPDAPEWTTEIDSAPPEVKALVVSRVGSDLLVASDPITESHGFRCVTNARR